MSDLDDWFSRCEDILADWNGGTDAMRSEPSKGEVELRAADSYYAQREYATPGRLVVDTDRFRQLALDPRFVEACQLFIRGINNWARQMRDALRPLVDQMQRAGLISTLPPAGESPRDRAIRLRRERNTGPADARGLDGRRRP